MSTRALQVLALSLLFCTRLTAAAGEAHWFIAAQAMDFKVDGEVPLGTRTNEDLLPFGAVETLELEREVSWEYEFGYRTSKQGVVLTWWDYDESATRTVEDPDNGFTPAFGHPVAADSFANRLDGSARLELQQFDLQWSRVFAKTDKSRWHWIVGLRKWSLDRAWTLVDDLDPDDSATFDTAVEQRSEADGLGAVLGLSGHYDFSKRIWGSAKLELAFVDGAVDVAYAETGFDDVRAELDGTDRVFRQSALDLRVNFRLGGGFDISVGYELRSYEEAVDRLVFVDDVQSGLLLRESEDLAFSGLVAALSYRF